jgi:DNA topoisomerase I
MARASVTVEVEKRPTRTGVETVFKLTARVRQSCDAKSGITRERTAKGFQYRTPNGKVVSDEATLARIRALAIPPAWEKVWICPAANGHIQATGRDARGRKQYRYHPAFRHTRDGEKFGRMAAFGKALPKIRERVEADLKLPGLPREKVLAAVVSLLDRTRLRVGNAEYAKTNKSFGLSTLLDRHASFADGELRLRFRGKSGVWHERTVSDRKLAKIVRACRDLPGQDLFQYRDEGGKPRPIGSADVNGYIRTAAGGEFTAKDFRTWAGTVMAAARFAGMPVPETKTATERVVVGVIRDVAAELGNTPAVCRKSYVHPRVVEAFAAGTLPKAKGDEARVLKVIA